MTDFEHQTNHFVYLPNRNGAERGFIHFGTVDAIQDGMKHLRERGIYRTPNGESFVASSERKTTSDGKRILSRLGNQLSCFLFARYEWAFHGLPDYEVATTGNVVALKPHPNFRPDQLIDTGATAGAH